jgi:putative two-component system response regulator
MHKTTRILLADDSATIRAHHLDLLKSLDAEIHLATNGRQALKMAFSIPYDLIITDVKMPRMTGIELCRALQNNPETHDIPIIIVSTFDSDSDVEAGFEAGASAYLSKKDAKNLLLKTVTEVLWKFSHVRQRRILVVEDSKTIARLLEMGLTKNSFLVTVAENGRIAKEILWSVRPDLIICDLKMPEMDGFSFCKWLKSTPEHSDIPLVAMSVDEETAMVQRIIQYGAAAYVRKPFSMNQLVPLIDRILSDHFRIILKERERLDAERMALVNSITSLVAALEARDTYTRGHSESVSIIVTQMLEYSGADKSDVELISIGGRLHDIGKIGIRDSVLLKPGRLEEEEFLHIKKHPTIGKRILETIPSLKKILPVPYSHHERWDGSGYPEGLKGKKIPFWARLTSVADTFDALTSDRPYRNGMSQEKAFQIIKSVRGSQLCPESVDLFFEITTSAAFEEHFTKIKNRDSQW